MKPKPTLREALILAAGSSLLAISSATAASGTWDEDANGLWSTSTNWASDIIADGSGSTANFTNDITADRTVSLDGDRTLTNLVFSDSNTATAGSWILDNNGTSTNNLILAGGTTRVITVNDLGTGKTATISAIIEGSAGLTKAGAGTLTLSGANTYTGNTIVNAGTLTIQNRTAAAGGAITVQNGGTLNLSSGSFSLGANSVFVGSTGNGTAYQNGGSISFTGGTQLLVGNGSSTGTYNLSSGTLTTVGTTYGVMLGVNNNATGYFNLSGTGILSMASGSLLQIARSDGGASGTTGVFTQTGGTATVGVLRIGGGNDANNGANGTLDISGGVFSAASFSHLSAASNSTSLIKISGTADVTLPDLPNTRGTGSTTATITFDGGTLKTKSGSTTLIGTNTAAQIKNGGAFIDTTLGSTTIARALENFSGHVGSLTKLGTNTLTLSAASTYTGATAIKKGTLALGGGNDRLPTGTTVTLGDGTTNDDGILKLDSRSQQLAGLLTTGTGTGNRVVNGNASAATLTLNIASGTNSFGGTLGGSGTNENNFALTKTGSGTLTLSGTNTYAGATSVNAGALIIDGSTHSSSTVTVEAGTVSGTPVAALGGTGTINGALILAGESSAGFKNGGVLAPGDAGVVDIETLDAGNTTWNGGSVWKFDLSSSGNTSDKLNITGSLTKGAGGTGDFVFDFMGSQPVWNTTYTLATFGSLAGGFTAGVVTPFSYTNLGSGSYSTSYFTLNGTSLTFTAVPEPTTALGGLLLTAGLLRRRRRVEG
jgi:fibronectin-binding autotransporter adhesin